MIAWLCGMESSVISTTIPSPACVVIAILDVAYRSTLALQPTAYQARAVAKEIRQLKFEDENTPFQEELLIRLVSVVMLVSIIMLVRCL